MTSARPIGPPLLLLARNVSVGSALRQSRVGSDGYSPPRKVKTKARFARHARTPRALHAVFFALALSLSAHSAWGQSAKTELTDPALATRFNTISDRLVCQCGCNMILRVCNHVNCPSGIPMRHEIEKQLLAGSDDETIVASFVTEYGQVVLSSPPASGFNLAAWVMPGFGLLIGLFVVFMFATRWAARRRIVMAPATPVDPALRQRIENELKSE